MVWFPPGSAPGRSSATSYCGASPTHDGFRVNRSEPSNGAKTSSASHATRNPLSATKFRRRPVAFFRSTNVGVHDSSHARISNLSSSNAVVASPSATSTLTSATVISKLSTIFAAMRCA